MPPAKDIKLNRRQILAGSLNSLAAGLGGAAPFLFSHTNTALAAQGDKTDKYNLSRAEQHNLFAATRRESDGTYAASIFHPERGDLVRVPLPARGHDITAHPNGRLFVAFARRPGTFAVAFHTPHINAVKSQPPLWFTTRPDRHFYGHGVFSPDGALLYATENDFENARGVISVRDVRKNYKQIGEFPTHGIGPHDLALMPDGKSLVIANGGIETHPESGRRKLNISEMEPNLSLIDRHSGRLISKFTLPPHLHKLSIRHLAVNSAAAEEEKGAIYFACQYHGAAEDWPPLIGRHHPNDPPGKVTFLPMPEAFLPSMRNYIGSICTDRSGSLLAASSPRGGQIVFWNVKENRFLAHHPLKDGCALAQTNLANQFILASGEAKLQHASFASPPAQKVNYSPTLNTPGQHWDNHAIFAGF